MCPFVFTYFTFFLPIVVYDDLFTTTAGTTFFSTQ
jgi:hypothetical protein